MSVLGELGELVHTYTNALMMPVNPHYWILNSALVDPWPGPPKEGLSSSDGSVAVLTNTRAPFGCWVLHNVKELLVTCMGTASLARGLAILYR